MSVSEIFYQTVRVPYRFAVGTLSGAVNWAVYLGGPFLAYKYHSEIGHYGQVAATDLYNNYGESVVEDLSKKYQDKFGSNINDLPGTVASAIEHGYEQCKWRSMPDTFFTHKGEVTVIGTTSVTGTLGGVAERYIPSNIDQYMSAIKVAAIAYGAYKLGLFELASVISKQAELTVETTLGVEGDAYGLFDVHHMLFDVFGKVYTAGVATVSKVPYTIGYGLSWGAHILATEALFAGARHYMGYAKFDEAHSVVKDVSAHPYGYGAVAALSVAISSSNVHKTSQHFGKELELWFEHAAGLTGDQLGLLDSDFYYGGK